MEKKWWMEAVVYEVYPRSFNDSNGDGIGDIKGITEKLDYLKDLGVTAIWICPFYESPMDDNGYDVSDFYKISQDYGSMEDVKELIEELKKREMRLIVDLVLNHTSDEHPWFIESRKSKDNPYRDYYIWQPPVNGHEPTNWESFFGGSVWEYDERTEEYYMKLFSKKMPDLNWRNEQVRKELYDITRFWIELGADGFRVDAVAHIEKDQSFKDAPNTTNRPFVPAYDQYANLPKVHDYIQEFNQEVLSKYDVMTVGEAGGASNQEALKYCGFERNEFNMLIAFDHCWVDENPNGHVPGKWTQKPLYVPYLKQALSRWQNSLYGKAWNAIYWSNHDQPRVVSHYGNDTERYRVLSAKSLATALYFMYGTPYVYQGEEIGMTNVAYKNLEDYRDVEVFTFYKNSLKAGISHEKTMKMIHNRSRDNARTPMQWDDTEHAGFSVKQPWIKVNPNYKEINVKQSIEDDNSIFNYYKQIFKIRKENKGLIYGSFKEHYKEHEQLMVYTRHDGDDTWLVIANFTNKHVKMSFGFESIEYVIGNYERPTYDLKKMIVRPYEACVHKIKTF